MFNLHEQIEVGCQLYYGLIYSEKKIHTKILPQCYKFPFCIYSHPSNANLCSF